MDIAQSWVFVLIGVNVLALTLGWLWLRRSQQAQAPNLHAELSGKISLLVDSQANLQNILSGQLQSQERTISKNLEERLTDLKQRMTVFDQASVTIAGLSQEVLGLQQILSNSKSRGFFGEVQLENLVQSVLPPNAYEFQAWLNDSVKPDCLLKLPNPPGPMAVDAKFPLDAYRQMIEAEREEDKKAPRRAFVQSMQKRIDEVADKYIIPGITADSALLFLPSESVFAELHTNFPDVLEYSYKRRVWIVSPTTMMATLNTVRAVMRDIKMREQAGQIQTEMHHLIDYIGALAEDAERLDSYNRNVEKTLRGLQGKLDKMQRKAAVITGMDLAPDQIAPPEIAVLDEIRVKKA